jgi:hypothetical protein
MIAESRGIGGRLMIGPALREYQTRHSKMRGLLTRAKTEEQKVAAIEWVFPLGEEERLAHAARAEVRKERARIARERVRWDCWLWS